MKFRILEDTKKILVFFANMLEPTYSNNLDCASYTVNISNKGVLSVSGERRGIQLVAESGFTKP